MMTLTNAFSVNMLTATNYDDELVPTHVMFQPLTEDEAKEWLSGGIDSAIGHPATAEILTARLGMPVKCNRQNVSIGRGGSMIVAQLTVPRLGEGEVLSAEQVAQLPIQFWYVTSES